MKTILPVLLVLIVFAVNANAQKEIVIYSPEAAALVDVNQFNAAEAIQQASAQGGFDYIDPGPAPDPYPQIVVWEKGMEQLGSSATEADGIWFLNHGKAYKKGQWALVLWKIDIPEASARLAGEFDEDLTLALWIDWNRDEMWGKNETVVRRHINIKSWLKFWPFGDPVPVYYLTAFRVPDLEAQMPASWWWGHHGDHDRGEIIGLWARGVVAYDDANVSPDGQQLFGDVEDYNVKYLKSPRPKTRKDAGN